MKTCKSGHFPQTAIAIDEISVIANEAFYYERPRKLYLALVSGILGIRC